jgi:hypothetical protein
VLARLPAPAGAPSACPVVEAGLARDREPPAAVNGSFVGDSDGADVGNEVHIDDESDTGRAMIGADPTDEVDVEAGVGRVATLSEPADLAVVVPAKEMVASPGKVPDGASAGAGAGAGAGTREGRGLGRGATMDSCGARIDDLDKEDDDNEEDEEDEDMTGQGRWRWCGRNNRRAFYSPRPCRVARKKVGNRTRLPSLLFTGRVEKSHCKQRSHARPDGFQDTMTDNVAVPKLMDVFSAACNIQDR